MGLSRRRFLVGAGATAAAALVASCRSDDTRNTAIAGRDSRPRTARAALDRLLAGNRRFVAGDAKGPDRSAVRRRAVARGQQPWAVVLGCVDSRVPPEILFDEGLGDLMVVRTAGQVIDAAALGSIEFAVVEFRTPLVMVLGHERCGAVTATVESVQRNAVAPGSVARIVDSIRPAVTGAEAKPGDLVDNAVRENVRLQVRHLRTSPLLEKQVEGDGLGVVGGYYDLDRGNVVVTVPA